MFTASQGAGGRLFQKNRRPSLAIVPCPLLPCQQALACALAHAISVHFTSSSKANKQGPPQYLRKQLFLSSECQCWRICWSGVSKRQDIDTPATLQTQQKELTFLDTDTISETRRPFQWNSFTHHPPRNTNKPTQTQCGKNTKLLHWWISQMHFPILLVQNCLTREISQNSKQPVLIHHSLKFTITNNWHIIWGLSNYKMYHRLKQTKTALDFYFRGNCRNKKTR